MINMDVQAQKGMQLLLFTGLGRSHELGGICKDTVIQVGLLAREYGTLLDTLNC